MRSIVFIFFIFTYCLSFTCLMGKDTQFQTDSTQKDTKVILITGASRGIGWETAKTLALQGHHVYASIRSAETSPIEQNLYQDSLHFVELDVTNASFG